jgi:hypothetical protein
MLIVEFRERNGESHKAHKKLVLERNSSVGSPVTMPISPFFNHPTEQLTSLFLKTRMGSTSDTRIWTVNGRRLAKGIRSVSCDI